MNKSLTIQIVKHIFSSFKVLESDFIDPVKTKSLMSPELLVNKSLTFLSDDGEDISNKIWGCQIIVDSKELKILLGGCSYDRENLEYCLIVKLQDAPAYGLYFVDVEAMDSEAHIAICANGKDWINCNTYLQATFLAGMEQIKESGLSWGKCSNYEENYKLMLSFIKYHNSHYEVDYEG